MLNFRYEWDIKTWAELWYFLFRRKRCLRCDGPLERLFIVKDEGWDWHHDSSGGNHEVTYAHTTKEKLKYRCPKCHAYFLLSDLAAARS
jgi:uncharacterized protein with PIN domain